MIIELLLNVILNVLETLLIFQLPQLPSEVMGYIDSMFDYLVAGSSILANYVPFGYLLTLFGVLLSVDIGINIYRFVMWILRKIPMLSIE